MPMPPSAFYVNRAPALTELEAMMKAMEMRAQNAKKRGLSPQASVAELKQTGKAALPAAMMIPGSEEEEGSTFDNAMSYLNTATSKGNDFLTGGIDDALWGAANVVGNAGRGNFNIRDNFNQGRNQNYGAKQQSYQDNPNLAANLDAAALATGAAAIPSLLKAGGSAITRMMPAKAAPQAKQIVDNGPIPTPGLEAKEISAEEFMQALKPQAPQAQLPAPKENLFETLKNISNTDRYGLKTPRMNNQDLINLNVNAGREANNVDLLSQYSRRNSADPLNLFGKKGETPPSDYNFNTQEATDVANQLRRELPASATSDPYRKIIVNDTPQKMNVRLSREQRHDLYPQQEIPLPETTYGIRQDEYMKKATPSSIEPNSKQSYFGTDIDKVLDSIEGMDPKMMEVERFLPGGGYNANYPPSAFDILLETFGKKNMGKTNIARIEKGTPINPTYGVAMNNEALINPKHFNKETNPNVQNIIEYLQDYLKNGKVNFGIGAGGAGMYKDE